jgi:hypothetical protein
MMTEQEKKQMYYLTRDMFELREYQPCFFDGDVDCGPWKSCPHVYPDCPLVRQAAMCGYKFHLEDDHES